MPRPPQDATSRLRTYNPVLSPKLLRNRRPGLEVKAQVVCRLMANIHASFHRTEVLGVKFERDGCRGSGLACRSLGSQAAYVHINLCPQASYDWTIA